MWWIAPEILSHAMQQLAPFRFCAYIDPGSGSMLVQLLVVGIAGLGITLKYAGGRVLSFLWPFRPRTGSPDDRVADQQLPEDATATGHKDLTGDGH